MRQGGHKKMKKYMKTLLGVIMSAMLLFAFAGCGGSSSSGSPEDEAVAALDETLQAFQSADLERISQINGVGDALTEGGLDSDLTQSVLICMFGHFEYELSEPEKVDDSHVNVPAKVSNVDMEVAANAWFANMMEYSMENAAEEDDAALQENAMAMLQDAIDATAEEENGIRSEDVVFPMVLEDGIWIISDDMDESVVDAMLGGFMTVMADMSSLADEQE